jgi:hypothetical protein
VPRAEKAMPPTRTSPISVSLKLTSLQVLLDKLRHRASMTASGVLFFSMMEWGSAVQFLKA